MEKHTQSILLVLWAVATFFASQWHQNDNSPTLVIQELVSNCDFAPPGEFRRGPYPKGIKWCQGMPTKPYVDLMNHMQVRAIEGDQFFIAQEYGSNVQLMYHPQSKTFMFNPRIVAEGGESTLCMDDVGDAELVERMRPSVVHVDFIDGARNFQPSQSVFTQGDACILQATLESLR